MIPFPTFRLQPSIRIAPPHGAVMAGGFALTCLLSNPAQAADQFCARTNPGLCTLNGVVGFNRNSDTYFWSPNSMPAVAFDLNRSSFSTKVKNLTLRGSSNMTINAIGNKTQAEVLIGSLGTNRLEGGNSPDFGPDTFVVGNPPANVNCQASGVDCKVSGEQGRENDAVILSTLNTNIIYIDRCLQMTAPNASGQPGKGGEKIATATKANATDANFAPITDATGTCPIASLSVNALQATALRGRDALLTPWERWWSATAPWSQGLQWLQQAMVALIQGPNAHAAQPSTTPQQQDSRTPLRIPTYKGVTRVIQNDARGNFLVAGGERGSTIVVNTSNLRFNQRILQPNRNNSTVYKQIGSESIPLNRGIAFVYHEPIGILASYPNDRYPYGSERNRGNVIAQLVLSDATALPAQAIDYVLLKNLYLSEGLALTTPTTTSRPIKTNP